MITLPVEEEGYPSLEALQAAIGPRTAALVLNNPDDMGIYNPRITEFIDAVHAVGGLCFYDNANFNGVMTRLRARDLGFDACMYMLHKSFGVPKGGNGPSVGAYGCSAELAEFLPGPRVVRDGDRYELIEPAQSVGRVREFIGNVQQLVKAYSWTRAMGTDGLREAADISVLANNYMEKRLMRIPGVTMSFPEGAAAPRDDPLLPRGVHGRDRALDGRRAEPDDRLRHRRLLARARALDRPRAVHPRSRRDVVEGGSRRMDRRARARARRGRRDPELVRTAPHNQVVAQIDGSGLDDPEQWAVTWAAYRRKHSSASEQHA
ncbi:PLP-dependent aminotransferase family protein [Leucobacter soli]|uniref:hypothetical protein n=1 Tax=Leucobacter soli TaxID=2812850 RepID=UPI003614B941